MKKYHEKYSDNRIFYRTQDKQTIAIQTHDMNESQKDF